MGPQGRSEFTVSETPSRPKSFPVLPSEQCMNVPIVSHPCPSLVLPLCFILAILVGVY